MGFLVLGAFICIVIWSVRQSSNKNVIKWQERKIALTPLGRYVKADIRAIGHRLRFILRRRQINDAMRTLDEELGDL